MSGRGTQQGLRKYLGAIKDTTTVGLAKVNSHYKELDISIVRATNHVERPAKEKHMKAIFYAISAARPRADVAYCIHALSRRLAKTHNWAVALKTLIVIHRALREVDPTFREELINYGRSRGHMLNMSHFKDDSSASAWDYSAFVRTYALYLEERLECIRVLKYDVETDPLNLRGLDTVDLLEQLLALQELLFRLLGCQPQGAAVYNFLIQSALSLVVGESRRIYAAISDGAINLVDKFFEMRRHDAVVALEIYRRAGQQAERLSEFYEICKSIDITRGEKLIKIEQPPASFLTTMEEYVKDAPRASTVRKNQVTDEKPKAILAIEYKRTPEVHETPNPPPPPPEPVKTATVSEQPDFLGLNDTNPDASELDIKNALALAIVPVDSQSSSAPTGTSSNEGTTSWELALVTTPSSSETPLPTAKLAGGLDKLTLDSLYDEGIRRATQTASYNPWEAAPRFSPYMQPVVHTAFYPPNAVVAQSAAHSAPMAAVAQQQYTFMLQQQQMLMLQQQQQQAPLNPFASSINPYGPGMLLQQQQAPSNPYPYTGFM